MPVLLLSILACAVFAQATSEFMLAGLVTEIAATFGVPVSVAGWCTSAFAVGMAVGAPLTALGARRVPPRTALVAFLAVFVGVHVLGALSPRFDVLLASRVVAALANAGFLAVALGVAARAVPPGRTARATGVLLAGTTVALVAGVPAGALLGGLGGWRATFWTVAALAAAVLVGVLAVAMPAPPPEGHRAPVVGELAVLRRVPVAATLTTGVLVNAATFAVYTFLGPMLVGGGRASPALVPVALMLFGVGAFLGVSLAARTADTCYRALVLAGGAVLALGWAGLAVAVTAAGVGVVLAAVAVLGVVSFAVGSGVIAHSLALARDAPTMGGSFTTAALNVGAALGPVLGGAALAVGPGAPAAVAVALVLVAAVPGALGLTTRADAGS